MKQTNNRRKKISGWLFFIIAIMLFCIQMGYFFLHSRYNVEYADNRIFFVINIIVFVSMFFSIILLLTLTKKWKMIIGVF
ncbi:hypothetical protein V7087_01285 [Neobacillus niacini]|uniref:hypothetical protein n=1 Tax=Neobacillus niacini TaxID=86668 RepID=UPI002FFEC4A5